MHIFTYAQGCYEMYCVLQTDRWELHQSYDNNGNATIHLLINDTVYIIYTSDELTDAYPDLEHNLIKSLYNAVIAESINCIKRGDRYIDLQEIYETQLSRHLSLQRQKSDTNHFFLVGPPAP